MAAGLEAAIFAVSGLSVDNFAAVFTLDSAHTGVAINEIFHQSVLIFVFPLFSCHSPQMLQMRGGYQNGNGHFHTIKRYDCLVGDQNDHQLNLRVTDRWYLDSLSTYHFTSKKW